MIGFIALNALAENENSSTNNLAKPAVPAWTLKKVSELIGVDVKNPRNERLGMLQDVAVNLGDGKISHGILASGGDKLNFARGEFPRDDL